MKTQSYTNHIRFYPPHHFLYYPVLIALLAVSIYFSITTPETILWLFIAAIFVILFVLGLMLRQHYALILQNRIVKLEFRYRYYVLTGERFELIEYKYTEDQIFALRFAPDAELIPLVERALTENLTGDAIKRSIVNWKGDYSRV